MKMVMRIIGTAISVLLLTLNLHTAALISVHNITTFYGVYPYNNPEYEILPSGCITDPVLDPARDPERQPETSGLTEEHVTLDNGQEYPLESEDLPQTQTEEEVTDLRGPIRTSLPEIDLLDLNYISFKKEVHAIIDGARKFSGIKTPVGVFVMDLTSNYYIGVNDTRTRIDPEDGAREGYFNSASVIKLFQGYILYDMLRHGELDEDMIYTDRVTGWSFKLVDMIHTMISRSDNNYSNACLRLVGNTKSNEVLARLGITDSVIYGEMSGAIGYSLRNNLENYGTTKRCARITPRDAGLILYNVYINKDSDPYMASMNRALLDNIYNTRIPVGVKKVDKGYEIAHKTGTNSSLGVYNDAGIVYGKRPFILVAFTQGTTSEAGHTFIRKLAQDLTSYFDSIAMGGGTA